MRSASCLRVACGSVACMLMACGSDTRQGPVSVSVYGEEFIEQGIDAEAFSDGWAVDFEHFVVSLRDVQVAGERLPDVEPIDLALPSEGAGHALGELIAEEGAYRDATFAIDRLEIEGTAVKGDASKHFNWLIEDEVTYSACDTTTAVAAEAGGALQITIHADHLFVNSLVSEEPELEFQPFAEADTRRNNNGEIEVDGELWEASIGDFDPGNQTVNNLWVWLIFGSRSIGHVDGEGHCHAEAAF